MNHRLNLRKIFNVTGKHIVMLWMKFCYCFYHVLVFAANNPI